MSALVFQLDGQLVLDDPEALAVIRAVGKRNCRILFEANTERVVHFVNRARILKRDDVVIVLINVDDRHGGPIADVLMPETDWQVFRDRGEIPIARGLADREGFLDILNSFDVEAATKMRDIGGLCVVVVDHNVAEVWAAPLGCQEVKS